MQHIRVILPKHLPPQLNPKSHPLRVIFFYGETPAMELRDAIDDRESDSHTFVMLIASFIDAVEFLLHIVEFSERNSCSIIGEGDMVFSLILLIVNREARIRSSIFDEVREDIV